MAAKTTAERQAAYRERRYQRNENEGDMILSTWLKSNTIFALNRLAKHHKTTKRAILEKLLTEADDAIFKKLKLNTPEWDEYFQLPGNRKE